MPGVDDKRMWISSFFYGAPGVGGGGWGGGRTPHMKGVGMLVVSLRSVSSGFWVFWAKRHHI